VPDHSTRSLGVIEEKEEEGEGLSALCVCVCMRTCVVMHAHVIEGRLTCLEL
jgi:hypothetical protein